VLNKWPDEGFFSDGSGKILGWCHVNGANALQVKQALYTKGSAGGLTEGIHKGRVF
jgi:hypothetical protein